MPEPEWALYDPDWAPSVDDVGAVLRSRTKDTNGNELGTFTDLTRPTDNQAQPLIETAIAEVSAEVGRVPDQLQDVARRVTALRAAMLVETSFWPEQVNTGYSAYPQLKEWFDGSLARLTRQIAEVESGDHLGEGDDSKLPLFSFPCMNPIGLW